MILIGRTGEAYLCQKDRHGGLRELIIFEQLCFIGLGEDLQRRLRGGIKVPKIPYSILIGNSGEDFPKRIRFAASGKDYTKKTAEENYNI